MSINVFADRKMAMGFAGVIAGLAMIAGLSMGAFTPRSDDEATDGEQPERVRVVDRTVSAPRPQPVANWENDGAGDEEVSDDWAGNGAPNRASFEPEENDAAVPGDLNEPEFGEYAPVRPRARSAPARQSTKRVADGPVIRSRAAHNAPALKAPGIGSTPPRLKRIN